MKYLFHSARDSTLDSFIRVESLFSMSSKDMLKENLVVFFEKWPGKKYLPHLKRENILGIDFKYATKM
jgi:hypothetical protein